MTYLLEPEVVEDLHRHGCPACRASRRAGRFWLRGLIRDHMTDGVVLETVEKAGGLCADHLFLGLEVAETAADSLGMALFADYLLGSTMRRLADRAGQKSARRRARNDYWRSSAERNRRCLACEAEERRAAAYMDILAELTNRRDDCGPEGWRFCLPHLLVALDHFDDGYVRQSLLRAIRSQADSLEQALASEIRRHDHDHRHLPPSQDPLASVETVRWLGGEF